MFPYGLIREITSLKTDCVNWPKGLLSSIIIDCFITFHQLKSGKTKFKGLTKVLNFNVTLLKMF